jgi:hypothetical protein
MVAGALATFLPPGPLFAALVVTAVVDGRGLRALRNRLLRWRVGWRWYAIALGLPLAVVLGATTVNLGFGAPVSALHDLDPWYVLVLVFAVRLINPLDGPLGDEPGCAASPCSVCTDVRRRQRPVDLPRVAMRRRARRRAALAPLLDSAV